MTFEWFDIFVHMGLEAIGGLVLALALGWCNHRRHQAIVWVLGAFVFSVLTVNLVG